MGFGSCSTEEGIRTYNRGLTSNHLADIDFIDTSNTITANINANAVEESMLKAVDAAVDEDIFTYESTTGDFEWHTKAELGIGTATAITDDLIVPADFAHSQDYGDFTIGAGGSFTLDTDVVAVAEFLGSQDWGDMSTAADGTVSLDTGVVAANESADDWITTADFAHSTDWGDVSTDGSGNVLYDADSIDAADINTINCGTNCTWDATNDEVDVDDAFLLNSGDAGTGDFDFGGADLELPQGQTPDTDGDIDLDFTDGSVVIQHGSAHAELGAATDVVVGKLIKSFSATIFAPDSVNDVIPLKPIVSGEFPHGIVVTEVHMVVGTDSNYTIDVENWDDFDTINAANSSINSTAYTSGNKGETTDSTITYSTIAALRFVLLL